MFFCKMRPPAIIHFTINNHFKMGDTIMATLSEILAKIDTIAAAGNVAAVQAEVDSLKADLAANSATDADQQTAIEALVDKLAAAPAPVEPTV